MTKVQNCFVCQDCGGEMNQWQGQCRHCHAWNSLMESSKITGKSNVRLSGYAGEPAAIKSLSEVGIDPISRISTQLNEFDRVLGGGLVSDAVILIGGDPGVGKSTLLLQVIARLSDTEQQPLYVTGEESLQQIAIRAQRLQLDAGQVLLLAETQVERIIAIATDLKPKIIVIDSVQTIFTEMISSAPGSVSQVRESAAKLLRFTKQRGIALFLIGHVTKEGAIAGPRVLEHMVDAVLYFEGQADQRYRVIRSVKNRFGAVNEIGIFAMSELGLKQVSNPSAIFLSRNQQAVPGCAVTVTWEGSRPLLAEVQALVTESHLANPRRVCVGTDPNRLAMLLAVMQRHSHIQTYNLDIFINIVGGLRVSETAVDLSLILAIMSSLKNKPLPLDIIIFGEVGLLGEIRPVPYGHERFHEAIKHGFKRAILPQANANFPKKNHDCEIIPVNQLSQALNHLF